MKENWDELESAIGGLEDDERDELIDHFNEAVSGLGNSLFGGDMEAFVI